MTAKLGKRILKMRVFLNPEYFPGQDRTKEFKRRPIWKDLIKNEYLITVAAFIGRWDWDWKISINSQTCC